MNRNITMLLIRFLQQQQSVVVANANSQQTLISRKTESVWYN